MNVSLQSGKVQQEKLNQGRSPRSGELAFEQLSPTGVKQSYPHVAGDLAHLVKSTVFLFFHIKTRAMLTVESV